MALNGSRPTRSSPCSTPASIAVFNWGEYCVDTTTVEKSGLISGCCKPIFSFLGCCAKTIFSCLGLCDCNCLPNCYGDPKQDDELPPKEVLIVHPIKSGTYPALLFFHGTCLVNSFYSHLLKHIASHGFIVVAPQLYELPSPASVELNAAEGVMDWLIDGLEGHLPTGVQPDFGSGLALAGHSRGGRTAFALADKLAAEPIKNEAGNIHTRLVTRSSGKDVNLSVLIGVDPVAASISGATMPEVDPDTNYFKFDVPAVVIGSGLGGCCAPESGNYRQFFKRCKPPKRAEFLATQYGHMDVLDDNPKGDTSFSWISALLTKYMCQNAKDLSRLCMSRTVGGIAVAFFNAYKNKSPDPTDLNAIVNNLSLAPAQLIIPDPEAAKRLSLGFS